MSEERPKIIVDEDWKAQVQAEKEAARHRGSEGEAVSAAGSSCSVGADVPPEAPLPPASLTFLLTTIATQAMIALGQVPNPLTGKAELRLQQAKHYIDTLGMLEEKTKGNRTPDESTLLTELLHQLRMAYVMMQSAPAEPGGKA